MSAITELLPAPASAIELPPAEVVPQSARAAVERYAAGEASRAELVAAVDQAGQRWEHAIASRAVQATAELVDSCRRVVELHDELVELHAAERWLRSFPWCSSWDPEPYGLYVAGREVAVPEVLGAIEDSCAVDARLIRIARQRAPHDLPYAPPAPRRLRPGCRPALTALAEAGATLNDVAELISGGVSDSAVSRWLAGERAYPDELPGVLEQLVDVVEAARILALIPLEDPMTRRTP